MQFITDHLFFVYFKLRNQIKRTKTTGCRDTQILFLLLGLQYLNEISVEDYPKLFVVYAISGNLSGLGKLSPVALIPVIVHCRHT